VFAHDVIIQRFETSDSECGV